ncbi:MAG: hypothetical protein Ta2A_25430 [Treponemataceae bacterium]|nr:MAG: hypothetical protein Ta2A_25430 [Treponemataceae bacterium]
MTTNQMAQLGTMSVMENMKAHPELFGCAASDEKTKTQFFSHLYQFIPKIARSYDPQIASFEAYIITMLQIYGRQWQREPEAAEAAQLPAEKVGTGDVA